MGAEAFSDRERILVRALMPSKMAPCRDREPIVLQSAIEINGPSRSVAAGPCAYFTSAWIDIATCPMVVELRAVRIGLHVRRDIGAVAVNIPINAVRARIGARAKESQLSAPSIAWPTCLSRPERSSNLGHQSPYARRSEAGSFRRA